MGWEFAFLRRKTVHTAPRRPSRKMSDILSQINNMGALYIPDRPTPETELVKAQKLKLSVQTFGGCKKTSNKNQPKSFDVCDMRAKHWGKWTLQSFEIETMTAQLGVPSQRGRPVDATPVLPRSESTSSWEMLDFSQAVLQRWCCYTVFEMRMKMLQGTYTLLFRYVQVTRWRLVCGIDVCMILLT